MLPDTRTPSLRAAIRINHKEHKGLQKCRVLFVLFAFFAVNSVVLTSTRLSAAFGLRLSAFGLLLLLAGCARFEPRPIEPARTAARFEQRTLVNPVVRAFLETNLHCQFSQWPPADWDEEMLTLVAFYYHPSLDVARADWQGVAAGIETAGERPNPTVTATGIYQPAASAFSPWIPGVVFDLPLETAGKRRLRTEQARHLSESARFSVATAAWQVRSHLRASLLEFESAQQRMALLQRQLAIREDLAARLESQFQAGAISGLERNLARLALVRARADLAESQRLVAEARPHLADALGLPTAALEGVSVHFDLGATGAAAGLTTPEARKLALQGRADILADLADYAAAQSALQLALAKQYPDIHLSPGYSWNGGSTGEHDWQLGVTVELPLLNRHQGAIAEAAARRQASATRFLALQAKVVGEIDAATASFRASQTNTTALGVLAAAQETQRQAALDQFSAGAVDQIEVLAADLELAAADLARFESRLKVQQALGALEDAVQRPLNLPQAIFQSNQDPQ